jgi:hypothetical protein
MIELSFRWALLPFLLQGALMVWDEFFFHEKRGLGRWEAIGHPLDTLTVLVPLIWVSQLALTRVTAVGFGVLALFSCVFVTKDEAVHLQKCSAGEQRLHALLFMLHPLIFLAMIVLWYFREQGEAEAQMLLLTQLGVVLIFGVYQTARWRKNWRTAP